MVEMKGFTGTYQQEDSGYGGENNGRVEYGQAPPSRPPPPPVSKDPIASASINQDLLISKTFYFFFFSAFGSLFPLLAVYFKQLGMNPTQSGMLIGIRPLVEFLSAPFWGSMADRFHKGKVMLLFSLFSWIVFTLSLAFIQPPAASCVEFNETHHVLYVPDSERNGDEVDRDKRSVPEELEEIDRQLLMMQPVGSEDSWDQKMAPEDTYHFSRLESLLDRASTAIKRYVLGKRDHEDHRSKLPPGHIVGMSPNSLEYTLNYDKEHHISYVSPPFSSIVYKWEDVQSVFFLLLLLVVLGEFFSAPAITLADSATLAYLGDDMDNYGKQRMFGSLGWGLAMFFIGIALDQSTSFPDHPCGPHEKERNYTICFATFSVLMSCAFIAATQFRFDYDDIHMQPQPAITTTEPEETKKSNTKSTVFAQTTRKLPEWFTVLRTFANVRYGAFLYVTWFMGFGIGLVFTFLFWHLQDLGGTPTLFGVASVINHISEIFAYFFSFRLIRKIGHLKVLCVGLLGNVCRFLYISWLRNPWWVLPFEFIQGITHAAVWAACCSYMTQATPANLRSSAQGVLQGLHHGLGRGCGAVIGGIFVTKFGTQVTFRGYGFASLIVVVLFILINRRTAGGFSNFLDEDPGSIVMEETGAHLAPHGVPANPLERSLSKQNLGDPTGGWKQEPLASPQHGGYLGVPGSKAPDPGQETKSNNPFMADGKVDESRMLSGPRMQTSPYQPQPPNTEAERQYDW